MQRKHAASEGRVNAEAGTAMGTDEAVRTHASETKSWAHTQPSATP